VSCVWFVGRVEENVSERDVCTIEKLSKVAITENSASGYWLRISLVPNGIHRWFGGFLVDAGRKTRRTAAQRVAAFLVRGSLPMLRRLLPLGLLCNAHHEREQYLLCRYNSPQMLATLLTPIVCLLRINTG
jgi:hypothetical protein